jgi:hypothetical protein
MKTLSPRIAATIAALSISASLSGDTLLLLQDATASADTTTAETAETEVPVKPKTGFRIGDFKPSGGFVHEFGANLSGGGSVSVDRGFAAFKIGFEAGLSTKGNFGIAWGGDWYHFDGTSELSPAAETAPWSDVQAIALSARVTTEIDSRWSATVGLDLRTAGERDADTRDSLTVGGLGAISYAFSKTFSLGAGAIVSSQIEDSLLVIPALVVYWQVTDTVLISNVLGPEVYPTGAGLEAAWRPDARREVAIGGRYESRRFRLDDDGPLVRRNGVGEDTGFPLWARATWRFDNGLRLDVVGGVSLFNTYSLDDSDGNELASTDLDPAPFIGVFGSWRF